MKTYLLERLYTDENVTLGRFWFEGEVVYTMELPWKDNKPNVSCIPEGVYTVVKEYSPHFKKDLWELKNVPKRSECKFHSASFVRNLKGCISLGLNKQDIDNDGIIDMKNSRKAMTLFHELVKETFKVEIIWNLSQK